MREIGDSSSAGSTPPPTHMEQFAPGNFFAEDPLSPTQRPAVDDDLWRHLADDGWCFFFDNHMHDSQQLLDARAAGRRSAVSEPLCKKTNAASCRPPRPRGRAGAAPSDKRKRSRSHSQREGHTRHHHHQEWDNLNGNTSFIQSLALENARCEISSTESGSEEEIQSDLPANEKVMHPEIGMEFSSEEEAYNFYKQYAEVIGFSIRKGKVQRLSNGAIRKRNFLCSRQGFKWKKISSNKTTKYERKETRTGCNASVQFKVEDGKWVISNLTLEHNHELDYKPWQTNVMDSLLHKSIEVPTSSTKTTFDDDARMRQKDKNTAKYINSQQVVRALNSSILQPQDVQGLMNFFSDLQVKDPSFFYAIQVDGQNHMTNFFWRDCRSRMDYSYFGDLIVFDTTFRIDNMIYAPFWGLNHHQQCVLFGCALLLDETLDSFVWLFKNFMVAMDSFQPKTLYSTEVSQEISTAIDMVFPKTEHRLDANHIFNNARQHLSAHFEKPGFETLLEKCIFNCETKQEFESQWNSLLDQYHLQENPWLTTLYKLWEKWSHLFNKKTFSAGIESILNSTTTNINVIFRNSSSEIMILPDFVQQYVKEAKRRRLEELREDLRCNKIVPLRSRKGMEKHAEDIYTDTMFRKFQDALLDSLSLAIEEVTCSGNISTSKLTEEGHKKEDIVTFDYSSSTVTCSCAKFESIGILCGHAIKVLNAKNIFQIPSQYILKRWTKSAKEGDRQHQEVVNDSGNDQRVGKSQMELMSLYSRNLMRKALNLISKSVAVEESRKMVEVSLELASKKADDILKENGSVEAQINLLTTNLEVDQEECAADSAIFTESQKFIASNSSCINHDDDQEGSKRSRLKTTKQRTFSVAETM